MSENSLHMLGDAGAIAALPEAMAPVPNRQDLGQDLDNATWAGDHPVNIRLSIPLPFRRFYITVVAGPERRGRERLEAERDRHPLCKLGNIVFLGYSGLIVMLALSAMIIGAGAFLVGRLFDIHLILT